MNAHRWSGWPGAFCLKCGAEDQVEIALADDAFDVETGIFYDYELQEAYAQAPCPVEDTAYQMFIDSQISALRAKSIQIG